MTKKCTLLALVFTALSISSLYAANDASRFSVAPLPANSIEKPQHPSVAAIITIVGIKCMRVPGIRQIALLPFGIGCTVYGVNELRKHQFVATALDTASKKIKDTVTVPNMMSLLNRCRNKAEALFAPSEHSETTQLPARAPLKPVTVLSPENAPTARPSAQPFGYGSSSSPR